MRIAQRLTAIVVFLLLAAVPSLASAGGLKVSDANADCLTCHAVGVEGHGHAKVDFTRPSVNRVSCRTCHSQPNHFNHGTGAGNEMLACGGDYECHWGTADAAYFADTYLDGGYYDNAASTSRSANEIHAIHVQRNNRFVYPRFLSPQCVNCHYGVACETCHGAQPVHSQHTYRPDEGGYIITPVIRTVSTGSGYITVEETCFNDTCHTISEAGTDAWRPSCIECHPEREGKHGSGNPETGF